MSCPYCGANVPDTATVCPACGSSLGAAALPVGTVLHGKYRIDRVLGQGGFGITYEATQVLLGSKFAIKELFPAGTYRQGQTLRPPATLGLNEWQQAKTDFTEEARTVARFNHPDIVRILDLFEENGTAYIVMERLEGETLQERLSRQGPLPPAEVEVIASRVAQALHLVHDAGLLHRDLKPDNIFLEQTGRMVLIDFGSARSFNQGQTVSHTRLVTPGYAPLEQYSNAAKFGPYTDLYALGATLHHALTGQMPPAATDRMMVPPPPLPPLPPGTPSGLRRATEQALAVQISGRPQTAHEFSALLGAPSSPPVPTPAPPAPTPPAPQPPTPSRKNKTAFWPLLAVLALGFGGFRYFTAHTATASAQAAEPATAEATAEQNTAEDTSETTTEAPAETAAQTPAEEPSSPAPAEEEPAPVQMKIIEPVSAAAVPAEGFKLLAVGHPGDTVEVLEDGRRVGTAVVGDDTILHHFIRNPGSGTHTYALRDADGTEQAAVEVNVAEAPAAEASTPPAAPAEDPVTDGEVEQLVDEYLADAGTDDVNLIMGLYAEQVDYFTRGFQPKSVLYDDKQDYYRRWPTRTYQRTTDITTLAEGAGTRQVRFDYSYDILRPEKEFLGTAYTVLNLVKQDGKLLISGEKGAIYPETQVRRHFDQPDTTDSTDLASEQSESGTSATTASETESLSTEVTDTQSAGSGKAPTFPQWYFTTCDDAATGSRQTGLTVGTLQRCQLVIETVPNGAQPSSASFSYELEFTENGVARKKAIAVSSSWPSNADPAVELVTEGDNLIFELPLTVKARAGRQYSSINVIGTLVFDNGGRKTIYEKLPIH